MKRFEENATPLIASLDSATWHLVGGQDVPPVEIDALEPSVIGAEAESTVPGIFACPGNLKVRELEVSA